MLRLILVRHAESEMNKLGLHQGQLHDSELSSEGVEQAKILAKRLEKESRYLSSRKPESIITADSILRSNSLMPRPCLGLMP